MEAPNSLDYNITIDAKEEGQWRWKAIRWKLVFRRQDHANLILTALLAIAVALVSFVVPPEERVYYIYDATISDPIGSKRDDFTPTVPNWVAIIVPLLMFLTTIIVGELFYSKKQHHSMTDAVAVLLYFLLDAFQSLLCALVVVQASKVRVGILRPDFLMRCQPAISDPNSFTIAYGQDTTGLYPCTNPDTATIEDGRKSFPSGHSAFSFNLATYASGYLIWCFHMRRVWGPRCLGPMAEFLSDLFNVVAKLWTLLMLGLAWGISMSRIIDSQHSTSDVLGGMLVGTMIAVIYILRAVPRYTRMLTSPCQPCEKVMEARHEAQNPAERSDNGNQVNSTAA